MSATQILIGHALDVLKGLPSESVDCCVTSPPYWGLRDYKTEPIIWDAVEGCEHEWEISTITKTKHENEGFNERWGHAPGEKKQEECKAISAEVGFCQKCGAWKGQLGLEPTPQLYIKHLVSIFDEVKRVLKPTGTCFVNLGDSYSSESTTRSKEYVGLSETDKAWLAALIDGEGSIQIHKQTREGVNPTYQADVSVGQKDNQMVEYAKKVTGIGSLTLQNRGVWDWGVRGQEAGHLLKEIYPYLKIKRCQARAVIELCKNAKAPKNGKFVFPENLEYRESLREIVHKLNQREPVEVNLPEPTEVSTMPEKCLVQIPSRFALAMTDNGWILRNEIIWHKPNCMPSSVKDRFTVDFEKFFFFVKSKRYYFETQYEPLNELTIERGKYNWCKSKTKASGYQTENGLNRDEMFPVNPNGRNKRTVWTLPTKPYKGAHFATYPPELVEVPIRAGCPVGGVVLDPFGGSGTTAMVANKLGRDAIIIELNEAYKPLIQERIGSAQGATA